MLGRCHGLRGMRQAPPGVDLADRDSVAAGTAGEAVATVALEGAVGPSGAEVAGAGLPHTEVKTIYRK